jgi:hypothetical protein
MKLKDIDMVERHEFDGNLYAIVLRSVPDIQGCRFVTSDDASLQLGVQVHHSGYAEVAHYHPRVLRQIESLHQVVHIISGCVRFEFFRNDGILLGAVVVGPGETLLLTEHGHRMIVLEDAQAVTVKQGPFLGDSCDKKSIPETQ